jgi:hypothetical protein
MESRLDRERQSQEELLEHIQYNFPDSMLADGYNSAIIGVAGGFDSGRVVYSVKKMVEVCMKELSVDADEAIEWLEYNTFGAFIGEYTPIYVDDYLT